MISTAHIDTPGSYATGSSRSFVTVAHSGASGVYLLMLLVIFSGMNVSAAMLPRRWAFVINSDFSGSIVWDGFAHQEKQIAEGVGFGLSVDSSGTIVESGGLRYFHVAFGPVGDVAVYLHRFVAVGVGYRYGWISQFVRTDHRIEDNPGGKRLCSGHQIRGQVVGSIPLKNGDGIDIIGIPYFTFGTLTRVPLALKIYEDIMTAREQEMLEELNEPVDYRGYGFELRIRGRHFITDQLYFQGSFLGTVQKTRTENDPLEEDVSNTSQGSFGLAFGLGFMFGGEVKKADSRKSSTFRDLFKK